MKTLFIVLVSSVVFAGCVKPRGAMVDNEKIELMGFNDFCKNKNAVLVVYVKKNGKAHRKRCPGIRIEESLPNGVDKKKKDTSFSLGISQKWFDGDGPDPCIEWKAGAYPYYYCW